MTDWTKPHRSRRKYIIIPLIIVIGVSFFAFFEVTPNNAMAKTLDEIRDLSEIQDLQKTLYSQYGDLSEMIRNGTDSARIENFRNDISNNLNSLNNLVDTKKSDFVKRQIDKKDWQRDRFTDETLIKAEMDCPTHPFKPGYLVLDPNKIQDAIYDRCFEAP